MKLHRLPVLFALLLGAQAASAELVGLSDTAYRDLQFVEGTALNSSSFEVPEAGTYRVTLTDFAFPQSFEELAVAITDAAASFFATQVEAGADAQTVFDVSFEVAGTYVASVFASLGGDAPGVGLYGLEISLSEDQVVIPLPPAALLLASATLLLGARRRRN